MLDYANQAATIAGWLTESEGCFLYNTARRIGPANAIVEIGSWKGRSSVCLGQGCQDGGGAVVYAVDPHTGSAEHHRMFAHIDTLDDLKANIAKAGLGRYVRIIKDTSENAARNFPKPVALVFIDGAHDYGSVKTDFNAWFPKITDGGLLAFHDSWHFLGPNLVTAIHLLFSSKIRRPQLVDTITCFEKADRISIFDRLTNIWFVVHRSLTGWHGCIKLKYHSGIGA